VAPEEEVDFYRARELGGAAKAAALLVIAGRELQGRKGCSDFRTCEGKQRRAVKSC
jgi:hypothetical protein